MARKVLLADDSVAVRKAVEATLAPKEFEVISVRKGAEAIREAKRIHPDVILLDCDLPDVDGYETCRRLKGDPDLQGIPVLLMSSDGEDEQASARAQEAGAEGYLAKPLQGRALADTVISLADMGFEPTLRIEGAEMEALGLEEEAVELDLGELELEGAEVLELTEELEPEKGKADAVAMTGEFTLEEGELDLDVLAETSGRSQRVKTEEIEEISFEEELEELDLGDLELEGAEGAAALEVTEEEESPAEALAGTEEVGAGFELEEEISLGEEELGAELDLLAEEPTLADVERALPAGAEAGPPKGLVDTDELEEISLEEDTLDLSMDVEEEIPLDELEETSVEFQKGELDLMGTHEELSAEEEEPTLDEEELNLEEEFPMEEKAPLEETAIEWEETPRPGAEEAPLEETAIEWHEEAAEDEGILLATDEAAGDAEEEEILLTAEIEEFLEEEPLPEVSAAPMALEEPEVVETAVEKPVEELPPILTRKREAAPVTPVVRPVTAREAVPAAPKVTPREATVARAPLLEELALEEEIASFRAEAEMEVDWERVAFQELSLDEVPPLEEGLRLELMQEDFGVVDPFGEQGIRIEIQRNLQDIVERILTDMAPPIVERVAREVALERAEKIIMEEIERLKSQPEGL
jgi:DNA-binding response OmpR family regulator